MGFLFTFLSPFYQTAASNGTHKVWLASCRIARWQWTNLRLSDKAKPCWIRIDFSLYADHNQTMQYDDLSSEILESAFFVAGVPSFFRSDEDVLARRAAETAIAFLSLIDDASGRPVVFSGTLARPEAIISLVWTGSEGMEDQTVIDFLYDGTWMAHWQLAGTRASCAGRDLETLKVLGLPLVFRNHAPPSAFGPSGP
ncbi:hypothetical protein [Hyphomicrobium zavarzinii]|uniref:hypothetical protein n=1 Tax=Hyphomicrobium zavarzinii TaxID=48292 RepID=UPI0012EB64BC|nr:hypothetical protein [Hyphomicrobium zavarzinii]